jgi:hypothetical protein
MLNLDTIWGVLVYALPAALLASFLTQRTPLSKGEASDYHYAFILRSIRSLRWRSIVSITRSAHWALLNIGGEYVGLTLTVWLVLFAAHEDPPTAAIPPGPLMLGGIAHSWVIARIRRVQVESASKLPPSANIDNIVVHYSKLGLKLIWLAKDAAGKRFLRDLEVAVETNAREQIQRLRESLLANARSGLLEEALAETLRKYAGRVRFSLLLRFGNPYHQRRLDRIRNPERLNDEWFHRTVLALEPVLGAHHLADAVARAARGIDSTLTIPQPPPRKGPMIVFPAIAVGAAVILLLLLPFFGYDAEAGDIREIESVSSAAAAANWCQARGAPTQLIDGLRNNSLSRQCLTSSMEHWSLTAALKQGVRRHLDKWVVK